MNTEKNGIVDEIVAAADVVRALWRHKIMQLRKMLRRRTGCTSCRWIWHCGRVRAAHSPNATSRQSIEWTVSGSPLRWPLYWCSPFPMRQLTLANRVVLEIGDYVVEDRLDLTDGVDRLRADGQQMADLWAEFVGMHFRLFGPFERDLSEWEDVGAVTRRSTVTRVLLKRAGHVRGTKSLMSKWAIMDDSLATSTNSASTSQTTQNPKSVAR